MKIDGFFTIENENKEKVNGNCLKSEFIELINDTKKYYGKFTIIYFLDGSIKADFKDGILMKNTIIIYKPLKK